jgi:hypothetical protein
MLLTFSANLPIQTCLAQCGALLKIIINRTFCNVLHLNLNSEYQTCLGESGALLKISLLRAAIKF